MPTFKFSYGVSILAGILRRIALSILLLAGVAFIILVNNNWLAGVIVIVSAVAVQWLLRVLANRIEKKTFLDKLRYDREFAEQTAESSPELKDLCLELNHDYAEDEGVKGDPALDRLLAKLRENRETEDNTSSI